MSNSGHPAVSTAAEVRFGTASRGFLGHVLASDPRRVVVAAPLPSTAGSTPPAAGTRAELVWTDTTAVLALPVELAGIQRAVLPLWHFRAVGRPTSVQRRAAIRVPLQLPVQLRDAGGFVTGTTLDISEGGVQCVVDDFGPVTAALGNQVSTTVYLEADSAPIQASAEVIRSRLRSDGRLAVTLRFVGLDELAQHRLRARVFLEERDRRAHGLI